MEIKEYINDKFTKLDLYKFDKYPDSIFYFKDDKFVFEHNKNYNCLWVNENIWKYLETTYNLSYSEICNVLNKYFLKDITFRNGNPLTSTMIEEEYKNNKN